MSAALLQYAVGFRASACQPTPERRRVVHRAPHVVPLPAVGSAVAGVFRIDVQLVLRPRFGFVSF